MLHHEIAESTARVTNTRQAEVPRRSIRLPRGTQQEHPRLHQGDQAPRDQGQPEDPQISHRVPPLPAHLGRHPEGHRLQRHGVPPVAGPCGGASGGGLRWRQGCSGSGTDTSTCPMGHY